MIPSLPRFLDCWRVVANSGHVENEMTGDNRSAGWLILSTKFSSKVLRSTKSVSLMSCPSYSKRSYAKKVIGASVNCFFVTFFLPILVCNNANGSGGPSTLPPDGDPDVLLYGIISPSRTTPFGK